MTHEARIVRGRREVEDSRHFCGVSAIWRHVKPQGGRQQRPPEVKKHPPLPAPKTTDEREGKGSAVGCGAAGRPDGAQRALAWPPRGNPAAHDCRPGTARSPWRAG